MIWYDTIVSNIFLLCCHVEGTSITCWEIMAWENVSKWCWSWNQAALLGSWKVNILKVLQECVRKYMWVSVHVVFLMDILPCPSLLLALASPILLLYNRLPYMLIIITVKPVWWSGERGYRSVLTHSLLSFSYIVLSFRQHFSVSNQHWPRWHYLQWLSCWHTDGFDRTKAERLEKNLQLTGLSGSLVVWMVV